MVGVNSFIRSRLVITPTIVRTTSTRTSHIVTVQSCAADILSVVEEQQSSDLRLKCRTIVLSCNYLLFHKAEVKLSSFLLKKERNGAQINYTHRRITFPQHVTLKCRPFFLICGIILQAKV